MATTLIVVAFRAIGWQQTVRALRQAQVGWLAVAVLANLAIVVLWAWQSVVFLPAGVRVRFGRMFEITALTATAANTAPAMLGQATGIALLAERGGVGAAAALGVFAQHQLVEGVAKILMLYAAARVAPLPGWMQRGLVAMTVAVGVFAVLLVGATIAARRRERAGEGGGTEAAGRPADGGVGRAGRAGRVARVRAFAERWAAGLVSLRSPRRLALGMLIALLMKAAEAGGWFAIERAFGVSPAPGSPFLALGAVNIASAVSVSPGNLGVYEAAAYFVYSSLHVPRETAFALAVAGHLCYLLPMAGAGYLLLSLGGITNAFRRRSAGDRQ